MSHLIEKTNGKINLAIRGRAWHGLGTQFDPAWTMNDWRKHAGLDWEAIKAESYVQLPDRRVERVDGQWHIIRSDNGHVLSSRTMSDQYQPVQPAEIFNWFEQYLSADKDHWQMDVAGALLQGERIWATASYNGGIKVAGANHRAYLLMTTSFDGTMATINSATLVKVLCDNTLQASLADSGKSRVTTSHRTKFDADRVGKELARVASGFASYKAMGEAMALRHLEKEQIAQLFKHVLDIPFETKKEDLSTRKQNQFDDLNRSYIQTVREENDVHRGTAWAALNAVTRYVDHDRSTRGNGNDATEKRFVSAQFGSGAALKAKAVTYLDDMCDGDLLRAVANKTSDEADVSAMLKQSFRASVGN
jgi:phage/plasmid-like protein (TIGR03299 family)